MNEIECLDAINNELTVAKSQLEAALKAKKESNNGSSEELIARIERFQYCRGRVDMAALISARVTRIMRQDAASEAWRRRNSGAGALNAARI